MKKVLALIFALMMCFAFAACGNNQGNQNGGNEGGNEQGGNEQGGNEQGGNEQGGNNTGGEEDLSVADKLDNLVKSFWSGDTMYEETVLLVAETDASGKIVSAPKAKLMFDATEIVEVKQYGRSAKEKVKVFDSATYTYKDGYLVATGEADGTSETFDTDLLYVRDKALTGEEAFPGLNQNTMIPSATSGLYLPFTEGAEIVKKQLYVTYKHAEVTTTVMPEYQKDALSKTINKLKKKQKVEVFVYGDSISTGANSSGYLDIQPKLDPWFDLVVENLSACYGGKVNLTNYAVGGWTSREGVNGGTVGGTPRPGLRGLFLDAKYLQDYKPDLAIIGFGMNDASIGNPNIDTYVQNIKSMIDSIRKQNANCDIILLGTMLANPASPNHSKNQMEYSETLYTIAKGYSGVAVVNVGKVHKAILDSGKLYTSMSANNVNHPNDFTTRMYASAILGALVK